MTEPTQTITLEQLAILQKAADSAEKRRQGMAKAREARNAKLAAARHAIESGGEIEVATKQTAPVPPVRSIYFDTAYHDYTNFINGFQLGIKQLDLRSPSEMQRALPFAEAFLKMCQSKYPSND